MQSRVLSTCVILVACLIGSSGRCADEATAAVANPFAAPSSLPFQLPPFASISDRDFLPAYLQGMREQRAQINAITHDRSPPTFDNTIVALEKSGQLLDRVEHVFGNLNASNTDPAMQALEKELAPKMAAHDDAIHLDPALYARIQTLFRQRDRLGLNSEQLALLERYHVMFVRAGANLNAADKKQLRAYNEELSKLTTQFRQNVLKATQDAAVRVDSESELGGLSEQQIGAAKSAASGRGDPAHFLIALQNTTTQPVLEELSDRRLRERIYGASIGRAIGGDTDNRPIIARIVALRAQRAKLLGYPSHAAYQLADESAGTPAAVHDMLATVAAASLAQARSEAADIQAAIDADSRTSGKPGFQLEPWDWAYYVARVKKQKFDFTDAEVKPYFELNRVLNDGVFYAAHELFGLSFRERPDLKAYRDDVRIFEVSDANGAPLALFLADYFARDNKQGGAWMSEYVGQSKLFGTRPVVVNNLNIAKPAAGQPVLLTFDEVTTLFHEFGHALHGMLSDVMYPTLSGTAVPRDFVEFPSQYNEMWAREPKVLEHFARDYRTGQPMPGELFQKVVAASRFGGGFHTTEYIAAALVDQDWHALAPGQAPVAADVPAFEVNALKREGVDYAPVPPRYHSPYFTHIFSSGYSAGYYAYLWSEVLARDTGQWLHEHGGLTRQNGDVLRSKLLSRGRTADPATMFREFYGKSPDIGPLLEYKGLLPSSTAPAVTR